MEANNKLREHLTKGDVVILKQHSLLENCPNMVVKRKAVLKYKSYTQAESDKRFYGFECMWFDKEHKLITMVFDFKDLQLVKKNNEFYNERDHQ